MGQASDCPWPSGSSWASQVRALQANFRAALTIQTFSDKPYDGARRGKRWQSQSGPSGTTGYRTGRPAAGPPRHQAPSSRKRPAGELDDSDGRPIKSPRTFKLPDAPAPTPGKLPSKAKGKDSQLSSVKGPTALQRLAARLEEDEEDGRGEVSLAGQDPQLSQFEQQEEDEIAWLEAQLGLGRKKKAKAKAKVDAQEDDEPEDELDGKWDEFTMCEERRETDLLTFGLGRAYGGFRPDCEGDERNEGVVCSSGLGSHRPGRAL